jgi:tRNA threonylcarbamoyladenosine biosynthesis protein TsaE
MWKGQANGNKNSEFSILTKSVEETLKFGSQLSTFLTPGDIVALIGDYGTGKTYLSKGIAFGLGVPENEYVVSPAFDLIHEYDGNMPVYHMDFYRIEYLSDEDLSWLNEYIYGKGVCIIEWADKFIEELATNYLKVELFHTKSENEREIHLTAIGTRYIAIVEGLNEE